MSCGGDSHPPRCSCAAARLLFCRALANLIESACTFAPFGGPVVVRAIQRSADVGVRVSDRGPGILPVDAERMFDRFTRGDHHRSITSGFGLGLPITREFVVALGGQIHLLSRERWRNAGPDLPTYLRYPAAGPASGCLPQVRTLFAPAP